MQLLVIQCRHQLKNFQRARSCLKHRTIYTKLSPYEPFSQIPTANFPSNSVAELASSVSPPGEPQPQENTSGQPQSSENAFLSRRTGIINPRSPATQFGIMAGKFLRHHARSLGFRVLPDGFVRVSAMLTHEYFAKYNFNQFSKRVKYDPMNRFEMAFVVDTVDGNLEKVWWVRATYGHSIPGVDFTTRRILHVGKLGTVYNIASVSDWEHIREYGIPQGPDHLIHLFRSSGSHLFLDHVPLNSKSLRISIDPVKALTMGVKFYHTKFAQLIATGNQDRTIPLEAVNEVIELELIKETLE